jgi:hypothetical protein
MVAVVDPGEIGRSAVYSRYNNGPRTLPWGMPTFTGENSVYSVPTLVCVALALYMWERKNFVWLFEHMLLLVECIEYV